MEKKLSKVSFEVCYTPFSILEISKIMSKLDLGIDQIEMPVTEVWSWTTTTKVDDKYLTKMRDNIFDFVEDKYGKVLEIKKIV